MCISSRNLLPLMIVIIGVVFLTPAAQATTWDLATDFARFDENGDGTPSVSTGLGPDGAWSYHAVIGGTETAFDASDKTVFSGDDGVAPDNQWKISSLDNDPWIALVEPGAGYPSGNDLEEGEINIQNGALRDQNVLIRWTAPSKMAVNMSGEYWGAHRGQGARGGNFQVNHTDGAGGITANLVAATNYGGAEFNQGLNAGDEGYVHKEHAHVFSSSNIAVNAGDTIELLSISTGACCGSIDGVNFTISQVPEPGTFALALLGSFGFVLLRRKPGRN